MKKSLVVLSLLSLQVLLWSQIKIKMEMKDGTTIDHLVEETRSLRFPTIGSQKKVVVEMKNGTNIEKLRSEVNRIHFGDLSNPPVDDLVVKSESNCYLVPPQSRSIKIPVSRANTAIPGNIGASAPFTVELLWTDNPNKIGAQSNIARLTTEGVGASGYIVVTPGEAEGNAVVVVKVGETVRWSWHIWVSNYDPTLEYISLPVTGKRAMTRNLGALSDDPSDGRSKGMYYQWGRKDPFPASLSFNDVAEPTLFNEGGSVFVLRKQSLEVSSTNLSWSVLNPLTFYWGSSLNNFDWYCGSSPVQNDNLWRSSKTVYDPCPEGWRVPTEQEIGGYRSSDLLQWSVTTRSSQPVQPIGYRNYLNGQLAYPFETKHYLWTVSVDDNYGFSVGDDGFTPNPNDDYFRSYALPIRCVKQ